MESIEILRGCEFKFACEKYSTRNDLCVEKEVLNYQHCPEQKVLKEDKFQKEYGAAYSGGIPYF